MYPLGNIFLFSIWRMLHESAEEVVHSFSLENGTAAIFVKLMRCGFQKSRSIRSWECWQYNSNNNLSGFMLIRRVCLSGSVQDRSGDVSLVPKDCPARQGFLYEICVECMCMMAHAWGSVRHVTTRIN